MSIKTFSLTLVAALAVATTASAQTSPVTPASVEPSIAFGSYAVVALRSNGDVLTWGLDDTTCMLGRATAQFTVADPTPTVIMHNVKEIAANQTAVAVVTTDGKVYSWGSDVVPKGSGYQPCDGPVLVPSLAGIVVTHIGLGPDFAVAVSETGDLYCAGNNYGCPVGQTRNPDSSFRSSGPDPVKTFTRLSLPELNGNVLDIRVGFAHTLVLTRDRKLYAFGRSRLGELGDSRFTQRGALHGFTPEPVLTNVVSFAAGPSHSVAVKDDGTVWTWGHNDQHSALCDGTTTDRRVPTELTVLPGQVVQVAAYGGGTLMRTKDGALYACGSDAYGQLGLATGSNSTQWTPIRQPTRVPVPAVKSSVVVLGGSYGAFSPDGCTVHIAGDERVGVRRTTRPSSTRFAPRAGLSLCALRLATSMPDIDAAALHRVPPAPSGVDCWMPKIEVDRKDPRLEPFRQAMLTVERVVRANQVFMSEMPESVRMQVLTNLDGALFLEVGAFPRQLPRQFGTSPYWTPTGCDIKRRGRRTFQYEHPLGLVGVGFNHSGWDAGFFHQSSRAESVGKLLKLKPIRIVAGFPVFQYRTVLRVYEMLVITKDGRLPIIPVTLADALDREAAHLALRLEEERKALAQKPPASVEALKRKVVVELQRQVEALRAYRASFSADELGAAWVQHDPMDNAQELDARVKALEALSPQEQAQVTDLGTRARALQRQATTRGTTPAEAARLRNEANTLLIEANAIVLAQRTRAADEVAAVRNDFAMRRIRPGAAADARELKDDPSFWDSTDPNRIQLITVDFTSRDSRETTAAQAKAWMEKVEATFDYQALKALIR